MAEDHGAPEAGQLPWVFDNVLFFATALCAISPVDYLCNYPYTVPAVTVIPKLV